MNTTKNEARFTAWGRTWTHSEAQAELAVLEADNAVLGPSDDRVTKAHVLKDGMADLAIRKVAEEESAARAMRYVEARAARRELDTIKEYPHLEDHHERMIQSHDAEGNRTKRFYTTRSGWLRAQIRILEAGGTIIFAG